MREVWRIHSANSRQAVKLAESLRIHPVTAQLLLNRGIATAPSARLFLDPSLSSLEDPFLLEGMSAAALRLLRAVEKRESIVIFGDSDVDGLTASVILYEALETLGAEVSAVSSNRIEDGYGLPSRVADDLQKSRTAVLVLVDCGTNQPDLVRQMSSSGMDVIIVDHHLPLEDQAQPFSLVNPHCASSPRGRELCSAGLSFKLSQALFQLSKKPQDMESFLDLAALGTLADCSPCRGDNRIFIAEGLRRVVESQRPGLQRLCEQMEVKTADAGSIIRRLVPRLNASGRLGDARAVWHLLKRKPDGGIEKWFSAAEEAHATTKQMHKETMAQAYAQINRLHFKDQYVMVVSHPGWHQGLMGPLASQLSQQYGRPAIAIAVKENQATGSGRCSVASVNLLDVLKRCQELLLRFGGHAYACGLTLDRKHIDRFRALVNEQAKASFNQAPAKERWVDLDIPLSGIDSAWVEETGRFSPFGEGNPEPMVVIRQAGIRLQSPRVGVVDDGQMQLTAKGVFPPLQADGRYDLLASPRLLKQRVWLAVADVKASGEL